MRAFRFGIVAISCFWAAQAGAQPPGSEYLQGETGAAVVLAHGRGYDDPICGDAGVQ